MAIDGITTNTTTTGYTSGSSSTSGLANNFTTFLSLLTTQLRNQNPLDPLDTNQFTQQLVQFAGVEQQLKTNDTLAALLVSSQTATASSALSLVGRTITADGDTAKLEDNKAVWSVNSPKDAVTGTVTVRNSSGAIVYTGDISLKEGDQNFEWDGKKTDGTKAPEGLYTLSIDAKDTDGNAVTVTSEVTGVVDGVDLSTGQAILLIGDLRIPLGALKAVKATTTS
ncbi:flagellar hook assembly protein FlgD [Chenggangzhangella methanolivorans]|uniref:Basal-body rod modification protein FlgD n=1 Tax=Chenggangzhangella methanolivorans TaxID=1437009 RepID=A0A9E6UH01_9HYPH|nr:flagellar hook assembly protein FlgD [Chenggangzhangella methanolivorans]QZN99267.1 flagellar hook assembly protein FlgD [Chenggangzhangella methanolivorans]